jgi:hypothetical protein
MNGYRTRLQLAQLRLLETCPVKTHYRKEQERKKPLSTAHQKDSGKLARKKWA